MRKIAVLFCFLLAAIGISQIVLRVLPAPAVISDAKHYDDMAQVFLKEHWIPPAEDKGTGNPLIYPPGYAVFLSGVYAIFGHSYGVVRVLHFLLLGFSAYLVFLITNERLKLSFRWSLVAGGMILVWPYFIMQSLLLYPEIVFTTVLLLAMYYVLSFLEKEKATDLYIVSALLAIGSLIRPNALLLNFWILGCLWILKKGFLGEWRTFLKRGVI
ncbi:glycosyltransferase family 39 protein, partial [Patescibacteria group bacterium]|nr:glycosyltransferase family 39 protein [Patescibacteria group bacterium]